MEELSPFLKTTSSLDVQKLQVHFIPPQFRNSHSCCIQQTDRRSLKKSKKGMRISPNFGALDKVQQTEMSPLREKMPRGSKNRPQARLFSEQTNRTLGLFAEAGQDDGRQDCRGLGRHSSAAAEVLPRIKAMKLDSGKTVLTGRV